MPSTQMDVLDLSAKYSNAIYVYIETICISLKDTKEMWILKRWELKEVLAGVSYVLAKTCLLKALGICFNLNAFDGKEQKTHLKLS